MSTQLPSGWTTTTLGEIGAWFGGGTPSKAEDRYWQRGTIPWVSPKDMKVLRIQDSEDHITHAAAEETTASLFPAGAVLVVVRSGILSRTLPVAVNSVPATMNQDLKGILPAIGIDPIYVAYYLMGHEREILASCCKAGTTVASIEIPRLKDFHLLLAPTCEQRRIVTKIEELFSDLDAGVAALERAKANLSRYRAAVLKAAVEGKLTAEWRKKHPDVEPASKLLERILAERRKKWEEAELSKFSEADKMPSKNWREMYEELVGPHTKDLPALPKGWSWATVEQVAEIQGGIQKQPSRAPVKNHYPYLRVANVLRGRLELSEVLRIELFPGELERLRLQLGDLLVVEGNGSRNEIGRSALWTADIRDCVHQNHIIRVRLLKCLPEFINAFWNSPLGQRQLGEKAASTSGLFTLSVGKISSVVIPLPPLDEQRVIVRKTTEMLSLITAAELEIKTSLQRSARLRQSILRHAFEGRIVPQYPKDEPASRLLERLKDELGAAEPSIPRASARKRTAKGTV